MNPKKTRHPSQTMDIFGSTDPRKMPRHFFPHPDRLDFTTAKRADISKQDYSVCPRHWYIDAESDCIDCGRLFTWTAAEQRTWFETYRFWVDSKTRRCKRCSSSKRHLRKLRLEYDSLITSAREHGDKAAKQRVIQIVEELEKALGTVPEKMSEARRIFLKQVGPL